VERRWVGVDCTGGGRKVALGEVGFQGEVIVVIVFYSLSCFLYRNYYDFPKIKLTFVNVSLKSIPNGGYRDNFLR